MSLNFRDVKIEIHQVVFYLYLWLQIINMQAELAFVHARLASLRRLPPTFSTMDHTPSSCCIDQFSVASTTTTTAPIPMPTFDSNFPLHSVCSLESSLAAEGPNITAAELPSFCNITDTYQQDDMIFEDGDLQTLTREFVSKFLPGVKLKSEPN